LKAVVDFGDYSCTCNVVAERSHAINNYLLGRHRCLNSTSFFWLGNNINVVENTSVVPGVLFDPSKQLTIDSTKEPLIDFLHLWPNTENILQ